MPLVGSESLPSFCEIQRIVRPIFGSPLLPKSTLVTFTQMRSPTERILGRSEAAKCWSETWEMWRRPGKRRMNDVKKRGRRAGVGRGDAREEEEELQLKTLLTIKK